MGNETIFPLDFAELSDGVDKWFIKESKKNDLKKRFGIGGDVDLDVSDDLIFLERILCENKELGCSCGDTVMERLNLILKKNGV